MWCKLGHVTLPIWRNETLNPPRVVGGQESVSINKGLAGPWHEHQKGASKLPERGHTPIESHPLPIKSQHIQSKVNLCRMLPCLGQDWSHWAGTTTL